MFPLPYICGAIFAVVFFISLWNQFLPNPDYPISLHLPDNHPRPRLFLSKEDTFHIVVFSDLHYGEDEATFGPEQDRKSTKVIGKILDFEKPNFVVISEFAITGRRKAPSNNNNK